MTPEEFRKIRMFWANRADPDVDALITEVYTLQNKLAARIAAQPQPTESGHVEP